MPGAVLALLVGIQDLKQLLAVKADAGTWKTTLQQAREDAWLSAGLPFFAYLIGLIVLTLLVGQKLAIPLFVGAYLMRWGHYGKRVAVAYALGAWALLVFFYGETMSLLFHPSSLALALQPALPGSVPTWLFF